ncbi:MAG: S9 family peptidase, partial [Acidobacteria bacterium]|nr:S9 family peptidase [Acidobacteriota bacterium]
MTFNAEVASFCPLPVICSVTVSTTLEPSDTQSRVTPPSAKKIPHITEIHGRTLLDDYFWLRDKDNPEVQAYLEAENAYTDAVMKPTSELQQKLYQELLSRIKETDVEVPYRYGAYFYYSRTESGKQYPIACRKRETLDASEEIVLDVNELAKGQSFMAIGAYQVSDDANLLAYSTDNTGFRQYTLVVKDLRTGTLLPERIGKTGSVAWANDNRTIFYTVEDSAKRQYRLYRHTLGSTSADELIYEEADERFNVEVFRTRSKGYLFCICSSHTTSEARYVSAENPHGEWKLIEPRRQDVEYYPDHNGDFFYVR